MRERGGIEAGLHGGIVLGPIQGLGDIDLEWMYLGGIGYHTQAGTLTVVSDDGAGNVKLDMTGWNLNLGGNDYDVSYGSPAYLRNRL